MEHTMRTRSAAARAAFLACSAIAIAFVAACHHNTPPVTRPMPPPPADQTPAANRPPAPPEPVAEPPVVPPEPARADTIASASLDDLNRNSPLKPVFFELDSAEVDAAGQAALDANAAVLK